MRIACIGQHGQVAQALAAQAPGANVDLVAAGRDTLDLRHPATLAAFLDRTKPDAVINAAAYNLVDRAETEPADAFAVNAEGPRALARLCRQRGLSLIHMSTDCVFDGKKTAPYTETDPPRPLSAYGRSKLAGEEAVLAEDASALVVRVCWVFSEHGDSFVSKMLERAAKQDEITVVSDQVGHPTLGADIACALIAAARLRHGDPAQLSGLLHVAADEPATRVEMLEEILSASRALGGPTATIRQTTTAEFAAPAPRPLNACLSGASAAQRLGVAMRPWRPAIAPSVAAVLARGSR